MKKQYDNMVKLAPIKRKITNAEKYADKIAEVMTGFCPVDDGDVSPDCDLCIMDKSFCCDKEKVRKWLMQETHQQ